MVEEGKFFYDGGRRLVNEWVDGRVRTFQEETGRRYTEIHFAGRTITVVREALPRIIPRTYGHIIIPTITDPDGVNLETTLPIKKPLLNTQLFIVEERRGVSGIIGKAKGPRLDLAIAEGLGISDEELIKDKRETYIDPTIALRITGIIFESTFPIF